MSWTALPPPETRVPLTRKLTPGEEAFTRGCNAGVVAVISTLAACRFHSWALRLASEGYSRGWPLPGASLEAVSTAWDSRVLPFFLIAAASLGVGLLVATALSALIARAARQAGVPGFRDLGQRFAPSLGLILVVGLVTTVHEMASGAPQLFDEIMLASAAIVGTGALTCATRRRGLQVLSLVVMTSLGTASIHRIYTSAAAMVAVVNVSFVEEAEAPWIRRAEAVMAERPDLFARYPLLELGRARYFLQQGRLEEGRAAIERFEQVCDAAWRPGHVSESSIGLFRQDERDALEGLEQAIAAPTSAFEPAAPEARGLFRACLLSLSPDPAQAFFYSRGNLPGLMKVLDQAPEAPGPKVLATLILSHQLSYLDEDSPARARLVQAREALGKDPRWAPFVETARQTHHDLDSDLDRFWSALDDLAADGLDPRTAPAKAPAPSAIEAGVADLRAALQALAQLPTQGTVQQKGTMPTEEGLGTLAWFTRPPASGADLLARYPELWTTTPAPPEAALARLPEAQLASAAFALAESMREPDDRLHRPVAMAYRSWERRARRQARAEVPRVRSKARDIHEARRQAEEEERKVEARAAELRAEWAAQGRTFEADFVETVTRLLAETPEAPEAR